MDTQKLKIAISGKSGCGNTTTSRRVAWALGYPMINYTFHTIADERKVPFETVCRWAEDDPSWDRYVDQRQVEMAEQAGRCVLGSRLAIWMLESADLSVYLTAPLHVRAERIREREGGEKETVEHETAERDRRDRERYLRIYGIDNDQFQFADLIVDTTNLSQQDVADRIIEEVRRRFGVPRAKREATSDMGTGVS
ncbi:MAG: (d)CMP kinase [Spirochaetales bacterium]